MNLNKNYKKNNEIDEAEEEMLHKIKDKFKLTNDDMRNVRTYEIRFYCEVFNFDFESLILAFTNKYIV